MTCLSKALLPLGPKKVHKGMRISVAIRVFHLRKNAYIPTGVDIGCTVSKNGEIIPNWHEGIITAKEPEWIAKNKAVDDYLNLLEERYKTIVSPGSMTCKELSQKLKENTGLDRRMTLRRAAAEYIESKRVDATKTYCQSVALAANRFTEWVGEEVRLERIGPKLLMAYHKYLSTLMCTVEKKEEEYSTSKKKFISKKIVVKKRQLSDGTITREMTRIKTILSYAIENEMVSYSVPPFAGIKLQRIKARQNDVSPEAIRTLRDLPLTKPRQCVARDVFMLSFYLGGVNYKDILTADLSGDEITYCREKTSYKMQNVVKVPVIPEAREIIQRWTRGGKWYAGFRHAYSGDEISEIGKQLKCVVREHGLPSCLTYGSARKSFSQFALEIGINDAVTNYLLGHSNYSRGIISYYNKVTPRMAALALRKVVDYMQHPEKYQEELERAIMV